MTNHGSRKPAPPRKPRASSSTNDAGTELPAEEAKPVEAPSAVPGIVGIGASAGGLEAFMRLIRGLAPHTGLAYVLVQHLARDHESLLPELLGRATTIPVVQARDGMGIEADHAYVIPPDATMSVADGHLRLVRRPVGSGAHLPIDAFLRSLAEVHGAGAIAVILSGAGSDGSRGVEAIKEQGGIVFAQDSESAGHPSMPESAVATGCVDFVLPPEAIAARLAQLGSQFAESGERAASSDREDDLLSILKLLRHRTGVDFEQYRRGTVHRRIVRRMLVSRQETRAEYLALVRDDPAELDLLYQDLLIGVTSFFRDAEVFDELRATVFPELARSRRANAPIRVWVAGCSGGEEAYSLAIALIEFLEEAGSGVPVQIFGTDLSDAAVARARAGLYPESIAEQVSPERLRHFFVPDRGGYRIAKFVRDLCIFSRQDITRDPPISHLDLISCRNVLIYFEAALQRRVFPTFHYALEPHGMLLLGTAESPGVASELFEPISKQQKIYRRRERPNGSRDLDFVNYAASGPTPAIAAARRTASLSARTTTRADDAEAEMDRVLVSHFGRHGAVVNEDLVVTAFRGDTTPFLVHGSGAASLDVLRLARPELVMPLRVALSRAATERKVVREKYVSTSAEGGDAGGRQVTIDVLPFPADSPARGSFLVLFREDPLATAVEQEGAADPDLSPRARKQAGARARELRALREELASTKAYVAEIVGQHEASIEELRAAGEEIQSSNEELQSTNEELETTKEEVQSTNEELSTLNDELRHRNRELGELASDLANVFASATIPIAIVGRDLRLRRFTPATSRVMKVIPTDVGRPLTDVKLCFRLPNLEALISNTVETLGVTRHLVQDDEGSWWALTIRPYQTIDRRVDGAVLVFADGAEASEERQLALEAAETARVRALRDAEALAASVAARERVEGERNAVLRQLESAQEEERRHLSRELHDGVGQHLTALALGLHALSDVTPPRSEVDRRVDQLRALVDTLGKELHEVALRLRPRVLDDFGLEAALSSFAEDWSRQSGIAVDVHAPGESARLPAATEGAVYRVAQEALNNIAKHSGANRASVTIERRDGQLHLIVEDDGKGFDADPLGRLSARRAGLGLLGIRERIALLGGTVDIESSLGRGTTLYVRVPIGVASEDWPEGRTRGRDDG